MKQNWISSGGIQHIAIVDRDGNNAALCGTRLGERAEVREEAWANRSLCQKCFPGMDRIWLDVSVECAEVIRGSMLYREAAEWMLEMLAVAPKEKIVEYLKSVDQDQHTMAALEKEA